jgi:hypothetical protein
MASALVSAALEDPSERYRADCRRSAIAWLEHWLQLMAREAAP